MLTRRTIAVSLVILPIWTVLIKFALPIAIAFQGGRHPGELVMWDFWWAAHLMLAYLLFKPGPFTFCAGMAIGFAEIVVALTKIELFLYSPSWNFLNTNWFVNKCAVLAVFTILVWFLLATPEGCRLVRCSWRRRK